MKMKNIGTRGQVSPGPLTPDPQGQLEIETLNGLSFFLVQFARSLSELNLVAKCVIVLVRR